MEEAGPRLSRCRAPRANEKGVQDVCMTRDFTPADSTRPTREGGARAYRKRNTHGGRERTAQQGRHGWGRDDGVGRVGCGRGVPAGRGRTAIGQEPGAGGSGVGGGVGPRTPLRTARLWGSTLLTASCPLQAGRGAVSHPRSRIAKIARPPEASTVRTHFSGTPRCTPRRPRGTVPSASAVPPRPVRPRVPARPSRGARGA